MYSKIILKYFLYHFHSQSLTSFAPSKWTEFFYFSWVKWDKKDKLEHESSPVEEFLLF